MLLNRSRANTIMERENLNALIASTPENISYLTDHYGDHWIIRAMTVFAVLAPGDDKPILVGPASIVTASMPTDIEVSAYGGIPIAISEIGSLDKDDQRLLDRRNSLKQMPDAMSALTRTLHDLGLQKGRVAVDERNFTREQFGHLEDELPDATFINGYETFRSIRAVKTPNEIERLRTAAQSVEAGLYRAAGALAAGVREIDLQNNHFAGLAKTGAVPLFTIICSGHRSAHTNTIPGDRKLLEGDVVRFDVGARRHFYTSDLARTFVVGNPTETQQRYWDAIVAGERAAIDQIKPGVKVADVFHSAVETTRASGLPDYERHHVGHGIGIEVYDLPLLAANSEATLEDGMVLCVETPRHELGYGGFQVEDMLVIRPDGVEMLSTFPRELTYR